MSRTVLLSLTVVMLTVACEDRPAPTAPPTRPAMSVTGPVVAAIDAVGEGTVRSQQRGDDVVTSDAVDRYGAVDEGFLRGHGHRVHRDAQRRHQRACNRNEPQ